MVVMWNSWHQQHRESLCPVSFLRYEDLLYHTVPTTQEICHFGPSEEVRIVSAASKNHSYMHHSAETTREMALE